LSRPTNRTLKWKLDHDPFAFDSIETRTHIQEAFNDWASHAGLTFREVTGHETADFNLDFVYGDHGDGYRLDMTRSDVAHAFYPWQTQYRGQIHFDVTKQWSDK
jgi:hypothetical protein